MPDAEPVQFEAALAEIEAIVAGLEQGSADLSGALAGYGRGVALLTSCQEILDRAERSVALLTGVDDSGRPVTTPFDAAATAPILPMNPPTPPPAPVPVAVTPTTLPKEPEPIRTTIPEAPF